MNMTWHNFYTESAILNSWNSQLKSNFLNLAFSSALLGINFLKIINFEPYNAEKKIDCF